MLCDMCGKEEPLSKFKVEGSQLNLCKNCAKYGTKVEDPLRIIKKQASYASESTEMVLPDFVNIIKQKRQSIKMTIEELAKKLSEKESVIQGIEKGRSPSISLAKKIEKLLNISLVKKYTESHQEIKVETQQATIGNMIRFKTRKK